MKVSVLLIFALLITTIGCEKSDETVSTAEIYTRNISEIDVVTATCGGIITSDNGKLITDRGICWDEKDVPDISDNKISAGDGAGKFDVKITHLKPQTKYYVRAYATNKAGTVYGSTVTFKTLNGCVDADSNVYHAITIGNQTWMVENLKTTKYNDGKSIPLVADGGAWTILTTPAYCWMLNNKLLYKDTYGALYNGYTVATGKLAPVGWHIPAKEEWDELEVFLQNNGYNYDGTMDTDNNRESFNSIAKALAAKNGWHSSGTPGAPGNTDYIPYQNLSGFTAYPGGFRFPGDEIQEESLFEFFGSSGFWWSTTGMTCRVLYYDQVYLRETQYPKECGLSVRCIKD